MAAQPDAIFVEGLDFFTSRWIGWTPLAGNFRRRARGGSLSTCWGMLAPPSSLEPCCSPGSASLVSRGSSWCSRGRGASRVVGRNRRARPLSGGGSRPGSNGRLADGAPHRGDGLSFPALDLFIHAWDLGKSVGAELVVPARVIDFTHHVIDPLPDAAVRNRGVFASAVGAPTGASESEEFIAWTGRDPLWSPSSNH